MINQLGRYLLSFIAIILVQVLVLNNLNLGGYINPWLYVLFILILPVETPNWLLLVFGFVTGLIMDAFLNTIGMHASATVLLAFLRPLFLRFLAPREGYETGSLPVPSHFGFGWFFKYALVFVTLWKSILSSLATLLVIMMAQLFSTREKRRI
ncbi:MAG: rod shape-determining protein MreD [Bacteroidales bacterium]|nr:rod shape-determining protein MreD [Bacteroidales bacterium]